MMIQPRIQYTLAVDGLVPPLFKETDESGNPVKGIWFAGGIMAVLGAFIPFGSLNDFVSCGYLFSFNVTNSALLLMKFESPPASPSLMPFLVALFQPFALGSALTLSHMNDIVMGSILGGLFTAGAIAVVLVIFFQCPKAPVFGGRSMGIPDDGSFKYYEAPLMPFLACASTYINWMLVSQLTLKGIGLFFLYILASIIFYFMYGLQHSVANTYGFRRPETPIDNVESSLPLEKDPINNNTPAQ